MRRKHLVRLLGLAAVTAAAVAIAATAPASTPPGSSLTVPTSAGSTAKNTWSGEVIPGINPASDCSPFASAPTTDDHIVTVNVPTGAYDKVKATFVFTITWTQASSAAETSDLILTLVGPNGQMIDSSDGGEPKESVSAVNLPAGNYHVLVCGFVNGASQPYSATAVVTTTAVTAPAPIVPLPGPGTVWGSPVKVTPDNGYGYEPTLIVDKSGNAFASAHKENVTLAISPDPNSPTQTRSMSWAWLSTDKGKTWGNTPGLTAASVENHLVGDEGDMALDDAGHVYYVDTYAGDVTLTRWTSNGLNKVIYDFTLPFIPTPEADDRPWITAHGDGHVFYFSNTASKSYNGGRYTEHASYDGGLTWDIVGVGLPDSGWCRPAADHRVGSKLVYAFCTNDEGKLYSYVSTDDGRSFTRYNAGTYNDLDGTQSYPLLQVAPNGTVYALYVDSNDIGEGDIPNTNRIYLFTSKDQGKTWTKQDVTPVPGRYQYAWLAVSPDGKKLGMGVYYRQNLDVPWLVAATTWAPGTKPDPKQFRSLDPDHPIAPAERTEPPGDYSGSYFFPDGKFGVVWTRYHLWTDAATILRDIFFARQN
jgi:hypothetical protein